MLVITRKPGEEINIGKDITVIVSRVDGKNVRLGITAPKEIKISRPDYNN